MLDGVNRSLARLTGRLAGSRRSALEDGRLEQLCAQLLTERGEASSVAEATEIVEWINSASHAAAVDFLKLLARDFDPDPAALEAAVRRWESQATEPDPDSAVRLWTASEAPRQQLFRRLNMAPGGTATLVALRGHLLRARRKNPELERVDVDLAHLFNAWFNPGFLDLDRISWETPADILERLIRYEAVHEIRGWDDLRARLATDRRCFAFFHPVMPREPLVFVEIALTRGVSSAIRPLIDPSREIGDPRDADTAVFYAISNCHPGLRGVSLGSFLIKQVVAELERELPGIRTFVTLSPIPGLGAWLDRSATRAMAIPSVARLRRGADEPPEGEQPPADAEVVRRRLAGEVTRDTQSAADALVVAYLLDRASGGRVADPVAHFHLSNGARLDRVNVGANADAAGEPSLGVMVNYRYERGDLEANHERYLGDGEVAMSGGLRRLAGQIPRVWPAETEVAST